MKVNFQGAVLGLADFRDAIIQECNFEGALFNSARLQEANLSSSKLSYIYLSAAYLDRTRLRYEQLAGAIGEEVEAWQMPLGGTREVRASWYNKAKYGYLLLKQNFDDLGDYEAASWAYRKERRMEKRGFLRYRHPEPMLPRGALPQD